MDFVPDVIRADGPNVDGNTHVTKVVILVHTPWYQSELSPCLCPGSRVILLSSRYHHILRYDDMASCVYCLALRNYENVPFALTKKRTFLHMAPLSRKTEVKSEKR